jgi:hypothetical protein
VPLRLRLRGEAMAETSWCQVAGVDFVPVFGTEGTAYLVDEAEPRLVWTTRADRQAGRAGHLARAAVPVAAAPRGRGARGVGRRLPGGPAAGVRHRARCPRGRRPHDGLPRGGGGRLAGRAHPVDGRRGAGLKPVPGNGWSATGPSSAEAASGLVGATGPAGAGLDRIHLLGRNDLGGHRSRGGPGGRGGLGRTVRVRAERFLRRQGPGACGVRPRRLRAHGAGQRSAARDEARRGGAAAGVRPHRPGAAACRVGRGLAGCTRALPRSVGTLMLPLATAPDRLAAPAPRGLVVAAPRLPVRLQPAQADGATAGGRVYPSPVERRRTVV